MGRMFASLTGSSSSSSSSSLSVSTSSPEESVSASERKEQEMASLLRGRRARGRRLLPEMAGYETSTSSTPPHPSPPNRGRPFFLQYSFFFVALFLLHVFISSPVFAAPQQYSDVDDNSYNFYYHHDSNYGMSEYVSDWSHEWAKMSGRIQQPKCVSIPSNLTLCQGIGYEKMMLPNLLDHDSLKEVTQQAGSWVPLTRINCHPDTKVFLCSLFSPVCLDRLIYPCRSLCESVRASCESRMTIHGFHWPEMLKCDRFPLDNDMCIMPIHDLKPDNNCTACKHPQTHEALIDHFCRSDVAMRVTMKDRRPMGGDMELLLRKRRKLYKFENITKKEARTFPVVLTGGASCTCETINATSGRYLLMGNKRNGRIVVSFAMMWKRKDKEFRKGLRAIRKGNCEQLFKTVINGLHQEQQSKPPKRDKGSKTKKSKRGKKGRKGKGRKGKRRKGRKGRKGRKKNGKKGEDGGNKVSKRDNPLSKTELEDLALSNFMKAAN